MSAGKKPPRASTTPALETTAQLLERARGGDDEARERLLARALPLLRAWARGRLPSMARDLADTDDLVQVTLLRAMKRIGEFQPRREGAFLAYLRTILLNAVREEIRRSKGTMRRREILDEAAGQSANIESNFGPNAVDDYEAALDTLPATSREAVILRIEFGLSYAEIAEAIGSSSPDAARMQVKRALLRLSAAMQADEA